MEHVAVKTSALEPPEYPNNQLTEGHVQRLSIQDVVVEGCFRRDLGDLSSLVASIRELGLLHPVVVNSQLRLIAGAHCTDPSRDYENRARAPSRRRLLLTRGRLSGRTRTA